MVRVSKQPEISEQTYHRWRKQYGGLKADDAKELAKNTRLKRIVSDKELEIDALRGSRRETMVGQHRSTPTSPGRALKGDDALRARLHGFSRKHKRWGYRKAYAVSRDEGWDANRKGIQRLWREEGPQDGAASLSLRTT
jgi:hypothetical protein